IGCDDQHVSKTGGDIRKRDDSRAVNAIIIRNQNFHLHQLNARRVGFGRIVHGENHMRITLLRNPKAGDGKHGRKELVEALEKAGHRTISQSLKKKGWRAALKKQADVVVVAGGDGAMAKVASALVKREVPLAILPLGTANNLARSLGFFASPKEIIRQLKHGKKRGFDVGVARGPWGKRF